MNYENYTLATVDLYEYEEIAVAKYDLNTHQSYADSKHQKKSFKIFGTNKQVKEYLHKLPVDEVWKDKLETEDNSYYAGVCFQYTKDHKMYSNSKHLPTREEYNNKLKARIDNIYKIYIARGGKVLTQ